MVRFNCASKMSIVPAAPTSAVGGTRVPFCSILMSIRSQDGSPSVCCGCTLCVQHVGKRLLVLGYPVSTSGFGLAVTVIGGLEPPEPELEPPLPLCLRWWDVAFAAFILTEAVGMGASMVNVVV